MGRPRKRNKNKINFPQQDNISSNASIDAEIDGTEIPQSSSAKTSAQALTPAQVPEIFTPEQVAWIFDIYIGLICFVFSMLFKVEWKLLWEELKIEDDLKLMWAKPLAKIASKHAPSKWAGMTSEIELVACVGLYSVASFGRAKTLAAKIHEEEKKKAQNARNAVTQNPVKNIPSVAIPV